MNKFKHRDAAILGGILIIVTIYWALYSSSIFLRRFAAIWWIFLFYAAMRWTIKTFLGEGNFRRDNFVDVVLLLITVFYLYTPYIKNFFLWRLPENITSAPFLDLFVILLIIVRFILWSMLVHYRIVYLERNGKSFTFKERLKITGIIEFLFILLLVTLKIVQMLDITF